MATKKHNHYDDLDDMHIRGTPSVGDTLAPIIMWGIGIVLALWYFGAFK